MHQRLFAGGIIWCYSERAAVPTLGENVRFQDSVPEKIGDTQGTPCLLILDDLLNVVYSQQVCDLFTKAFITGISA